MHEKWEPRINHCKITSESVRVKVKDVLEIMFRHTIPTMTLYQDKISNGKLANKNAS